MLAWLALIVTSAIPALVAVVAFSPDQQCSSVNYGGAADAHKESATNKLAGLTRSVVEPFRYAILTPESRVYAGPPPGWEGSAATAAVVITPALGAHFSMYLVDAPRDSHMSTAASYSGALRRIERFLYVLRGGIHVRNATSGETRKLEAGGFCYYAPSDPELETSTGEVGAAFVLVDREYAGKGGATSVIGTECEISEELADGEVFKLRRLLDKSNPAFDFNIHIMDFAPGEYLNVKEVHYNQHGLLMLDGLGMYMLGDRYYPVMAGDVIYMAPFVPQWYGALGLSRTRYFLYKDTNINPLHAGD